MRHRDRETRERVLKAAAQLFADRGFKKVTVRDICRAARANVAAVNYHFGDKGGLYREVLQLAIETMRATRTPRAQRGRAWRPRNGFGNTSASRSAVRPAPRARRGSRGSSTAR